MGFGFYFTGCATIFSDGKDDVTIKSNVPGVKVFMDGNLRGETPLNLSVKRKLQKYKMKFVKEGYETQEFELAHEFNFNTGMVLDLTGTAISLTPGAVDALSGNLIRYSPTEYQIEMMPIKASELEFKKVLKSKNFAAFNFKFLVRDIVAGKGEYLDSLIYSFNIPKYKKNSIEKLIHQNKENLLLSENGIVLWDKINTLLENDNNLNISHLN